MQDDEDNEERSQVPKRIEMPETKRPGGHERGYDEIFECDDEDERNDNWILLMRLLRAGCTDTQVGEVFNIRRETFWRWRNKYERMADFYTKYKSYANNKVVDALYERATGMKVLVNKPMIIDKKLVFVETEEYHAPDIKAAEVWLYNRDKENWKKLQHVQQNNPTTLPAIQGFDPDLLEPEELEMLLRLSKKAAISEPKKLEE